MNKANWDDIRFVLAVRRHGSLKAAATALNVTHATVLRRVAAFEQRHTCHLFGKATSGYVPRPEAQQIFAAMEDVENAVLALDRTIAGADRSPVGKVRIASTDSLCQIVLPCILRRISERFPGLEFTLLSNNTHHDLTRLTADIVVRPSPGLDGGLTGQMAGTLRFAVYHDGTPGRKWLALQGALGKSNPAQWMADNIAPAAIISGADSFLVLRQMAAEGAGRTFLPTFVGDAEPRLKRDPETPPGMAVPLWVAMLEEIAHTPRFALVRDQLLARLRPLFAAEHA
ncbi:MAG: LysR family transcriptional regulator [Ruegeria sp.]